MPSEHSSADSRLHARVRGRVQGVNFRYYTRERALQLGLCGWVRNLPDGSVEVLAEGPRPALQQLEAFLHRGPPSAAVHSVDAAWSPPAGGFTGFDVRP